jgi:threonine/homoserine/homoserine lactone efflux protein
MDLAHLLVFAAAYLAVLAVPGPGVTALVARVLAHGAAGAPALIAGIVAGALVWLTVAATGLAAIAQSFAGVFVAIRWAGAAYLLHLAWKLWNAPARPLLTPDATPGKAQAEGGRMFLTGLSINLGNPKAIMFFLALLPTVVDLGQLTPLGFLELAAVIVTIATSVLAAYALAAARARRLFTSPGAVRLANRGSGAIMAGTALTIVAR